MKKGIFIFISMLSTLTLVACGNGDSKPVPTDMGSDRILSVQSDSLVQSKADAGDTATGALPLILEKGTQISVLGHLVDDHGQEWVRLGLDKPELQEEDEAAEVWVALDALLSADLRVVVDSDPFDENGREVMTPASISDEGELIAVDIAGSRVFLRQEDAARMTYCYKYVKQYLLKHKMVSVYLPGGSAYMAAGILPKHGFYKVARSPKQAIVHDVCVYSGGPSGHGHIEIKTSQGWYYGYGYKSQPIKNRPLIACFHK